MSRFRQASDKVVLNFDDAVLYESELELFAPGQWLNDMIINFGFRFLDREIRNDSVLLMDPAVYSFMMLQCQEEEELAELRRSLRLAERSLVLIPINDAADFTCHRGTHWSLLAYRPADKRLFQHFDSQPTSMHSWIAAPLAADKLTRVLTGKF